MNIDFSAPINANKRFQEISLAINGSIEFGNPNRGPINIKGTWAQLLTPVGADTEFTITHNLGYIPTGLLIMTVDKAAQIYASRMNQWTTTVAFFKCNQGSVNLVGFVV